MHAAWVAWSTALLIAACGDTNEDTPVDAALLDAGADAQPVASWDLTGSLRGIDLQSDVKSAIVETLDDGTSIRTVVTLTNLEDYCAALQVDPSCPSTGTPRRLMTITVRGTQTGTSEITTQDPLDPPDGEAGVVFNALGDDCQLLAAPLAATSGSVTFSQLLPGEVAELSFQVTTAEGSVSGTVTTPWCP